MPTPRSSGPPPAQPLGPSGACGLSSPPGPSGCAGGGPLSSNVRPHVPKVSLPPSLVQELDPLVGQLEARGWVLVNCEQSGSFGNFEARFVGNSHSLSVVRDRGQFHVDGLERSALESAGLWRSFSGVRSLEAPLLRWLAAQGAV